jgi:hypothetical protein
MKFEDKFKPGDIICSDLFHSGLCMVVEYGRNSSIRGEFNYRCDDLVRENQGWCAYELSSFLGKPYNWRIATDDDIANYLSRFVHIPLGKVGDYEVTQTDKGICFDNGFDFNIYFEAEELVQLGKIINERVVG